MANRPVKPGDKVKDFTLESHKNIKINTAEFKGKKILLSFHPLAWTSVCAKQMKKLDQDYNKFVKLNTIPLGFSVDSAPSKAAWAKSLKITKLNLLADFWPHGGLAKRLGIFLEKFGISGRVNIILDEQRKVIFAKVYPMDKVPDFGEIIDLLERICSGKKACVLKRR